ncbi:uncharacterized protein LOC110243439 [Exaiptasia diaphana]|uniref:Uncharacterized protein n=1 Tax=Exaiptasia diaphana TaxID=2652724 RepID=A0A913XJ35_EXADI|nr:uncharacterized protein LOC110243439 [Exaiptasia diaphana]KXJ25829.1 hypothetical protein AC249_AIPGENE27611 [Exaiptasia diaphana]
MAKNCTINILNKFVEEVEEMEKCVLVPNRLQDIGPRNQVLKLSQKEDVEDVQGLHDLFLVLKNIKSELTTGHGLELGKDLNPIKTHLQEINKLLLNMSELAKTVRNEYKKEYDLVF